MVISLVQKRRPAFLALDPQFRLDPGAVALRTLVEFAVSDSSPEAQATGQFLLSLYSTEFRVHMPTYACVVPAHIYGASITVLRWIGKEWAGEHPFAVFADHEAVARALGLVDEEDATITPRA